MPRAGPTDGLSDSAGDIPHPSADTGDPPSHRSANTGKARATSRSPTPIPGTPGQDPELQNSFDATARASTESQYTYILESVDPAVLAIAVEQFVEYNCSNLDVDTLKALYIGFAQDRAPPVEPPKQQAQVGYQFYFV